MTMTLDAQHQRFGPSAMPFDYSSSSSPQPAPAFTNPWTSSPPPQPGPASGNPGSHAMYLGSHHHLGPILSGPLRPHEQHQHQQQHQQQPLQQQPLQQQPRPLQHQHPQPHQQQQQQQQQPLPQPLPHRSNTASSTSSLASYASSLPVPVTTGAGPGPGSLMAASYEPTAQQHPDLIPMSHDVLSMNRLPPASAAFADYSTSASPVSASYASSGPSYDGLGYAAAGAMRSIADDRKSFAEALDASHGMLAMSQETPRGNAYGGAGRVHRDSSDSYGFPNSSSTHSTSSSISSQPGGTFNSYYADSLSEYSTAGSDIESVASRSGLPPSRVSTSSSLMSAVPPAPQTMMGQFSSKLSGTAQKKHKCRVCDKRFTRPSSLQTHMYSHTGEKPFACEVEGCGRHFSVVSNLRRHKKVHRQQHDTRSEAGSEDQDQDHQSD